MVGSEMATKPDYVKQEAVVSADAGSVQASV